MKSKSPLSPLPLHWTPPTLTSPTSPFPFLTYPLPSLTLSFFSPTPSHSYSFTTSTSQVLLFVVDGAGGDGGESGGNNPASDLRCLWKELKLYDEALITKPKLLFINKSDLECKNVLCLLPFSRMFHHKNIILM